MGSQRILVLGDNEQLAKAVALNLAFLSTLDVELHPAVLPSAQGNPAQVDSFDLIIVAMSSPASEPIVALANASLTERVGRVPLLIITDRPFPSDHGSKITRLDFPFEPEDLVSTVTGILQTEASAVVEA